MKGREETTAPKPETASFENPADQAVLADIAAQQAAGNDPFGDNDPPEGEAAPAPPAEATAAPAPAPAEEHDEEVIEPPAPAPAAAAPAPASAAEAPAPAPAATPASPPPLNFKTRAAKDIQDDQTALLAKKADAFKQYSEGVMSPEAYMEIDAEVTQGMMRIGTEVALATASQQSAQQQQESVIDAIKRTSKAAGHIDYNSDAAAAEQFNAALAVVSKDPAAATMSNEEFYNRAHSLVLFQRGITAGATAAPASAPGGPRKDVVPAIPTLRGLPSAATPNTGGGVVEQLGRLQGLDFEEAVGAIPRAQRDAWLDS